jgi:pimeloyl-ACP methyl ester carboxylesterase
MSSLTHLVRLIHVSAVLVMSLLGTSPILYAQSLQSPGIQAIAFRSREAILSGTLVFPERPTPIAALVLVHGSGREPRLLPLARELAKCGFAVLTYDKRGVGKSGGIYEGKRNVSAANLHLLADDAAAALATLSRHPRLRGTRRGFAGISQAGWIIPLAAQHSAASFIVLWSGPVCRVSEELHFSALVDQVSASSKSFSRAQVANHMRSVPHRVDDVDPSLSLSKLSIPGLWIFGDQDTSIPVDLSVTRLNELIRDGRQRFGYRVYPGLGHDLEMQTLPAVAAWIKDVVEGVARGALR